MGWKGRLLGIDRKASARAMMGRPSLSHGFISTTSMYTMHRNNVLGLIHYRVTQNVRVVSCSSSETCHDVCGTTQCNLRLKQLIAFISKQTRQS